MKIIPYIYIYIYIYTIFTGFPLDLQTNQVYDKCGFSPDWICEINKKVV